MSKKWKVKNHAATTPPPRQRRSRWLTLALIAVAAAAAISIGIWLVQRSQPAPLTTGAAPGEAASSPVDGPRLALDQDLFDYGDVKLNSTIETEINVKNIGDEVLALAESPRVDLVEGC